ncbi:probable glutathione S-transferase GSTU6 [Aegilops tauschii subsp. strangulata]|uniref:Glutathione S-transferase n=1 Tax=Aegilops tauschii TaxID=37682 RepID=M8AWK6_AEGTA
MAGGDDLKLLGIWASPHVLRVRLALHLRGLSYEYVEEQGLKNYKSDELLLNSKLPVLIHDGKPVYGISLSLIQYLDEAFAGAGSSLLPDDPSERAIARYWGDFMDDTLVKAMEKATWSVTCREKAEVKAQVAAAMETLEGALRECSKPFFGGDSPGYVDVVLGGLLPWLCVTDKRQASVKTFDPITTPLLLAWQDRFCSLKKVQGLMPDVGELVDLAMPVPTHCSRESLQVILILSSLLVQIATACSS